jgi:hypothetical protein
MRLVVAENFKGEVSMKSTALFDLVDEHIKDNLPDLVAENLKMILLERDELKKDNVELKKRIESMEGEISLKNQYEDELKRHKDLSERKAAIVEAEKKLEDKQAQLEKETLESRLKVQAEKAEWIDQMAGKLLDKIAG